MLTQTLNAVQNLDENDATLYQQFQPELFDYMNKRNAKWANGAGGTYQAGAFNNAFVLRGKDNAFPATCLAGGPGSAISSDYKKYFNHQKFRVVLSDWRGVGTSQPKGPIETNTTEGLILDLETMRKKLGSEKMMISAGSWGATVAMGYAQAFPERVSGLVLRLPFLASKKDTEWNYGENGIARAYPEAFESFYRSSGAACTDNIISAYNDNLQSMDIGIQKKAFMAWMKWEYARSGEIFDIPESEIDPSSAVYAERLNRMQIMANYTLNDFFINKGGILDLNTPIDVPSIIIANDRDPLSRNDTLDIMKASFSNAEYIVQENADWHWIFNPESKDPRRSNGFVENANAYAVEKIRRINESQNLTLVQS